MKPNNFAKATENHAANYLPKSLSAQKILAMRAKSLAEKKVNPITNEHGNYIRFGLGKEHNFGVDFDRVKEIIRRSTITPLPLAPDFVAGVINYRGRLIAIIDLRALFSLKKANVTNSTHIIIVGVNQITVGFLTSYIDNSRSYNTDSLEPPLAVTNKLKKNYVIGLHNGATAILNTEVILKDFQNQLNGLVLSNRHS
ncbi:MAG: chemotaxis protein CheW [Pseudomonadota bacterium]